VERACAEYTCASDSRPEPRRFTIQGVHRIFSVVLKYLAALMSLLVVLQIFLAGEGIFGLKNVVKLSDAKTLDAHRVLGDLLSVPLALLLLIVALLAWHASHRVRILSLLLPFILFIQFLLAFGGRWVGALHPLNGFLILGLLGWLTYELWHKEHRAQPAAPATG
jgi:hypothetical protein